jgi:RimJ/RimL family protein N-acetyltransferase
MDRLAMWPVFGLRVRTPRLELRPVDPDLAFEVAELAAAGVHDPAIMPFAIPWTDAEPPALQQNVVRYYLETWAQFRPEQWRLPFAVLDGDRVVGVQDLGARDFPVLRQFTTGSWVGRSFQGRGIGREMRTAVLHVGFAGLDARRAQSDAFTDNAASLAVTRALGYRPNGTAWYLRRGEPAECLSFILDRDGWEATRRDDIVIEGLDERVRSFMGL